MGADVGDEAYLTILAYGCNYFSMFAMSDPVPSSTVYQVLAKGGPGVHRLVLDVVGNGGGEFRKHNAGTILRCCRRPHDEEAVVPWDRKQKVPLLDCAGVLSFRGRKYSDGNSASNAYSGHYKPEPDRATSLATGTILYIQ